jgi:hypothetical protein
LILYAAYKIKGTEYGGFPPPLIGLTLYVPPGTTIGDRRGFKSCPTQVILKSKKRKNCPKGSEGGRLGRVKGIVAFRGKRVPEEATLHSFFTPSLGVSFLAVGQSPVPFRIPWVAEFGDFSGGEGFGADLIARAPLVQTGPGAPDVSVEEIDFDVGAARQITRRTIKLRRNRRALYYLKVPKRCPKGGFPFKSQLTFASVGDLPQQTVAAIDFAPCPRR